MYGGLRIGLYEPIRNAMVSCPSCCHMTCVVYRRWAAATPVFASPLLLASRQVPKCHESEPGLRIKAAVFKTRIIPLAFVTCSSLQVPKGHEGEPGLGIKIAAGLTTGAIGISVASPTDLVKASSA